MSINEKINFNATNSVFVIVFKNRRWEQFVGWRFDDVQAHRIGRDRYKEVIHKLNERGYYET